MNTNSTPCIDDVNPTKRIILFVHYGDEWIRGSERCLLDLIKHIDTNKFTPIVWCNNKKLATEVKSLGITCITSTFNILLGWNKSRYNILSTVKLIFLGMHIIKKWHVDIIHTNSGAPNQWMVLASYLMRRPLVAHIHSPYIFRDRLTLGLHFVPQMVTVSQCVAKPFLNDGRLSKNTHIVHNGIDMKRFQKPHSINIHQLLEIPSNTFLFACVGSLIERKGIDNILIAFKQFMNDKTLAKLLILGDGEERQKLEQQAYTLGLTRNVIFWGECNNVDEILTSGINVLVSGAREEAFGLVFAEAGAAKLPVIAPNIDGIPEVVIHNQTGILYPDNDLNTCSRAMRYLYKHPNECLRLGQNGFNRVEKLFTIKNNVKKITEIYINSTKDKRIVCHSNYKKLFSIILNKLSPKNIPLNTSLIEKKVLTHTYNENKDHV